MGLITKIQYRNCEPGEFTAETERSCEETIRLIEAFPWGEQRDHLVISITNPSVTIQTPGGDYLKLALYYRGKYVLYYFNNRQQLYTRSFPNYQEAYPFVRSIFSTVSFDPTGFHQENIWGRHISIHFITKDFTFHIAPQPTLTYACIGLLGTVLFIYQFFFMANVKTPRSSAQVFAWIFSLILTFLWLQLIALFINHYRSAWKKVLILSKGNDIFYYGNQNAPERYDKNEILDVITYGGESRYGGETTHSKLTRVEIYFKRGTIINISCLMMRHDDLIKRLAPAVRHFEKDTFPFIPPSASIPS